MDSQEPSLQRPEVNSATLDESVSQSTTLSTIDKATNLQLFYATALLKMNPGMGRKSETLAKDLVNSGLKPSEAVAMIQTVYSPTHEKGGGQATRAKYFTEAFQERYCGELDKISGNITTFRRVLMDMSDASGMRDTLKGEGYNVTFHEALLYFELGMDAESYLSMAQELRQEDMSPRAIQRAIREAAMKVQRDPSLSLESLVLKREHFGAEWEDIAEEDVTLSYENIERQNG